MVTVLDPKEDYVFQNGNHAGESTAVLMFSNPSFIYWFLGELNKKISCNGQKNKLHQQLEWLVSKGDNRPTVALCPHCGQKTVKYYSIRHSLSGSSFGSSYTYCEDCVRKFTSSELTIESFKFSNLKRYDRKGNGPFFKEMLRLYRWAFGLSGRLDRDKAFDFFKN